MKLSNRERAYVPSAKLRDYLLSERHNVGRSKARFFRLVGFTEANRDRLEQELLAIAQREEIKEMSSSVHGTKFVLEGSLLTPSRGTVQIRTVWAIDRQGDSPRFVTAYPL